MWFWWQRCNVIEPLKYDNGPPCISILNNNLLDSKFHLGNTMIKNDTRLRIFSGTANPALSQVLNFQLLIVICYLELGLHLVLLSGNSSF